MAQKKSKHPVDVHVGQQIRLQRQRGKMTQQQLAEQVGVKFQQIQKYETGANRVSASRLWDIAHILQVPVKFFFTGLESTRSSSAAMKSAQSVDVLNDKETIELLRIYYAIPENQRRRLLDLVKSLST